MPLDQKKTRRDEGEQSREREREVTLADCDAKEQRLKKKIKKNHALSLGVEACGSHSFTHLVAAARQLPVTAASTVLSLVCALEREWAICR